jgi:hypothetical protein
MIGACLTRASGPRYDATLCAWEGRWCVCWRSSTNRWLRTPTNVRARHGDRAL